MYTLLSILSGTLLYVICPVAQTGPQVLGYYMPGTYVINQCNNIHSKVISSDTIKYHEMGHLFWFMYLKHTENNEEYASNFAICMQQYKCSKALMSFIIKTINLGNNSL